jgi:oligoribonuclease (3'-5' exoribonuclease)
MSADPTNLIWIDLEMTGLIPERHRIIEIATLVTDQNLNVLAEGPVVAVHQPEPELGAMGNLDVSTLKELCLRWAPGVARGYSKDSRHLALDDIRDSVDELRYYREHFLRLP